jgi:hypothetical protein
MSAGSGWDVARGLSLGLNVKGLISVCDCNDEIEALTGEPWLDRAFGFSVDLGAFYRPMERIHLGLTLKDAVGLYPDFEIFDFFASGARARDLPRNLQVSAEVAILNGLIVAGTVSNILRSTIPVTRLLDPGSIHLTVDENFETSMDYHLGIEWEFAPGSYLRGGFMSVESVPHLGNSERERRIVPTLGLGFVFERFGLSFATLFDKRDTLMRELIRLSQSNEGYRYALGVMLML